MELQEFKSIIGRLTLFFDKKPPSEAAIMLWYEKVRHIPYAVTAQIYNRITAQDGFPKNVGNAFLDEWSQFKQTNPSKIIRDYGECHECGGVGLLFASKGGYRYVFACGSCRNFLKHFAEQTVVARLTIPAILSQGFMLIERRPWRSS